MTVVSEPTSISIPTLPRCNSANQFDWEQANSSKPTRDKIARQSPAAHRARVCGSHNAMSWNSNNNTIIAIKAATNGAAPIITS